MIGSPAGGVRAGPADGKRARGVPGIGTAGTYRERAGGMPGIGTGGTYRERAGGMPGIGTGGTHRERAGRMNRGRARQRLVVRSAGLAVCDLPPGMASGPASHPPAGDAEDYHRYADGEDQPQYPELMQAERD